MLINIKFLKISFSNCNVLSHRNIDMLVVINLFLKTKLIGKYEEMEKFVCVGFVLRKKRIPCGTVGIE